MIKLTTEIDLPVMTKKLGYRHQSMMIGSCFAENMGNHLQELCFPVTINPFGILYNPVSIANSLTMLFDRKIFTRQDLFYHDNLYHSFSHHSKFSGPSENEILARINAHISDAYEVLKSCSHLFITFGTSWVFRHKETGKDISNCHKLPGTLFDRYRLTTLQITEIWAPVIQQLVRLNPQIHLVFSVSPIRHMKEGAHGNQLSKAILLLGIDELESLFGADLISYFPSFEILLDEFRDYRFYAADLTHPSDVAIGLIGEKFDELFLDAEAKTVSSELKKLVRSNQHRSQNYNNIAFQLFMKKQSEDIQIFKDKYPFIDLKKIDNKCE